MTTPPTIKEEGARWTIENARPLFMRMAIGAVPSDHRPSIAPPGAPAQTNARPRPASS